MVSPTDRPSPVHVSTGDLPSAEAVLELVADAHQRFASVSEGAVADYIPILGDASADWFGICIVSVAGRVGAVGDTDQTFSIQSISKPFVFALVCDTVGPAAARKALGVNNTGLPFNSVMAIELNDGRPMNPMVNAGAIATTSLVPGADADARWGFVREGLSRFAGRDLELDEAVYQSESSSNLRNRGIAHLLDGYGHLHADPDETVDVYTKQCSLLVSTRDLAIMGATLADGGVNPLTGERVVDATTAQRVLAVLATSGLYERSGDWLYDCGLPGKSGVSGGIVTVSPGKGGLGVFSPPLDAAGNSVRGQLVTQYLSEALGLNLFKSEAVENTTPRSPDTRLERTDVSESLFRLPRTVVPDHYDITLDIDPARDTFAGTVGVDVRVLESGDRIVLNAADLDIDDVVLSSGSAVIAVVGVSHDDRERTTLQLETDVDAGSYRLDITYRGILNDQLRGLYRSVYEDAEGAKHPIATSQCQPTDARRILPCWDEPDFKATFRTTMIVPDGVAAFSNTAEVAREQSDGRTKVSFATSMKMSTYLLAFIAGPFEATAPVVVRGTPIRIVVPRGNLHRTEVAMENAIFSFEYMSDYFGIPYPGDKLDHIAVPDFAAGAMENVGLITYRAPYLVIDRANASQSELQTSLDVIAHEVAHQWFGNLVTMAWWEGTWLNEAFANLMQMKATNAHRPEWKRWLAFANVEVPWAMGIDQLGSTRPVEFEVTAPEDVNQMFDAITYGKGSAVLHMVDEFTGTETFRAGVRDYLHAHEYANTSTADLFESLDQESEWPISEIMSTWIFRKGFPQIEVSGVAGGARLAQHRYLVIPDDTDTTRWQVPIELRGVAGGEQFSEKVLLADDEMVVDVGDVDWIVANVGGHGFYRTQYSDDLFTSLLAHLEQLDDVERYWLVSDTLALVRNGEVDAAAFLDLVDGFAAEREQAIWSVITGGLGTIEHHALTAAARPAFEAYVRSVVGQPLDRLGSTPSNDDSDLDRRLRGDLIVAMGVLGGDAATVARCAEVVEELLSGSSSVDPEVTTAALTVFAHGADRAGYERLWNAYLGARTPIDEARFVRAVGGVTDVDLATTTFDRIVDGSIRTQDRAMVFARLLSGSAGPTVWRRAAERWETLLEAVPSVTHSRLVEGIAALSQPGVADDVERFLTEHPMPEAAHAVRQNLERLDANVRLRARQTPAVTAYFSRVSPPAGESPAS